MNDQFLSNFQEQPHPKYAAALYQRINKPMKSTHLSTHGVRFVSLCIVALLLLLALSPTLRAYAQTLFFQIGRLFITQEPTYAEQYEGQINKAAPSSSPSESQGPMESQAPMEWQAPPLLSLAEASAQAQFPVAEINEIPQGLSPIARFVTLPDEKHPFTQVTTSYATADQSLVLSQTLYLTHAQPQNLPAGDATVMGIFVHGVNGLWVENLRLSTYVDPNNKVAPRFANVLIWEQGGFEYRLQASPGLPKEEMLRITSSLKP